ncbi:MAG: SRPBCC domain-containing protein [Myxococcota bacterium]
MSVTAVRKDPETLTMTMEAEFDAPVARVWQVWADPRKLERWWGPPTWPATFDRHALTVGAEVRYHMTGPEGEVSRGWWRITEAEPPRHLVFEDGFAGEDGEPQVDGPVMVMTVALSERASGGTRMVLRTRFPSLEALQEMVQMGMEEGMKAAMGQIDAILAE